MRPAFLSRRQIFKVCLLILVLMVYSIFNKTIAQEPRAICHIFPHYQLQLPHPPTFPLEVAMFGTVISSATQGGHAFTFRQHGCGLSGNNLGQVGHLPAPGTNIIAFGSAEESAPFDCAFWTEIGVNPVFPSYTSTSINGSRPLYNGTAVRISGFVSSWQFPVSLEGFGLGVFSDGNDSLLIDFGAANMPSLGQQVDILAVVDNIAWNSTINNPINTRKGFEVIHWVPTGTPFPSNPDPIAWTIADANYLDTGSIFFVKGAVTSWTDSAHTEGHFWNGVDSIPFVIDTIALHYPQGGISTYLFGKVREEAGQRFLHVYHHVESVLLSIEDQNLKSIEVYPNPVKERLTISGLEQNKSYEIIIFNSLGKEQLRKVKDGNEVEISVNSLFPGIYYLIIRSEEGKTISQEKFIKK